MNRRTFVARSAGTVGAAAVAPGNGVRDAFPAGHARRDRVAQATARRRRPITDDERRARIEKAQTLMTRERHRRRSSSRAARAWSYFTGVRWGNSERTFGVVIPAKGELAWVTPGVRGSARTRADQVLERRPRLAGRREPVQGDRADHPRSRRRDRQDRHRGARPLLHLRRRAPGAAERARSSARRRSRRAVA